ncbi:alpha/beta hydrolase [Microbulbifer sp. ANSA003]|uniref:alpha/beta hydrolase n=1 Tax=Microbulbifer sp. ANSA003 TaxID=3243360 RepID=UPI004042D262
MRKYISALLVLLVTVGNLNAAEAESIVRLETKTGVLEGSLLVPGDATDIPVALIISGSGPTDRDGNNPAMRNDSLKLLATALWEKGIASLRYDKRAIGKSQAAGLKESDLRFEHYIEDAKGWINLLRADERFNQLIVIGHSEGSLIGMIASQGGNVDKFISIVGAGQSADKILKEQLKLQPPEVLEIALPIIDKLAQGETVDNINPMLGALFRPSIQPYIISWFNYDPAEEIAKLDLPVLIVQGSTDIQVSEEDAKNLAKANPTSEVKLIEGMNHVLKESVLDRMKNIATYNQPQLPVKAELVESIVAFTNGN